MDENIEITPEIQKVIDLKVKEATKGLYTKDDLQREVTREVDRRVESGIQKGLETHREKWRKEFEEQSRMTAEELAQKQLEEKLSEIESREIELATKANRLEAKSKLANAGIPKEHYEKFIDLLVDKDDEVTVNNVNNFIETFNETKTSIERAIEEKYSKIPAPRVGGTKEPITKKEFDNMGYDEKLKLKEKDPELFNKLIR